MAEAIDEDSHSLSYTFDDDVPEDRKSTRELGSELENSGYFASKRAAENNGAELMRIVT